jgi:hypothetical protein
MRKISLLVPMKTAERVQVLIVELAQVETVDLVQLAIVDDHPVVAPQGLVAEQVQDVRTIELKALLLPAREQAIVASQLKVVPTVAASHASQLKVETSRVMDASRPKVGPNHVMAASRPKADPNHVMDVSPPKVDPNHVMAASRPKVGLNHVMAASRPKADPNHVMDASRPKADPNHVMDVSPPKVDPCHDMDVNQPRVVLMEPLVANLDMANPPKVVHLMDDVLRVKEHQALHVPAVLRQLVAALRVMARDLIVGPQVVLVDRRALADRRVLADHQELADRQVLADRQAQADLQAQADRQPVVAPNALAQPPASRRAVARVGPEAQEQNVHPIAELAKTVKSCTTYGALSLGAPASLPAPNRI